MSHFLGDLLSQPRAEHHLLTMCFLFILLDSTLWMTKSDWSIIELWGKTQVKTRAEMHFLLLCIYFPKLPVSVVRNFQALLCFYENRLDVKPRSTFSGNLSMFCISPSWSDVFVSVRREKKKKLTCNLSLWGIYSRSNLWLICCFLFAI